MGKKAKLIEPIWAEFKDVAKAMVQPKKQKAGKNKKEPEQPEEDKEEVKKSS